MKTHGFVLAFILANAAAVQALNTVSTLNGTGWGQSQQGLIGQVGPSAEGPAAVGAPVLGGPNPSNGVLQPMLGVYPDLLSIRPDDLTASLHPTIQAGRDVTGHSAPGLIGGLNGGLDFGTGPNWTAGPGEYADAGLTGSDIQASLPAVTDVDWADTALPTARETSFMEIVVFPALGALLLFFAGAVLVLRLRRRKEPSRAEQLLHV